MICVIATIETRPGRRDDLLEVFRGLVSQVRAESGCIEYATMIDAASGLAEVRDNVVTVVEKWESLAALENHLKTPHMAKFFEQTASMRMTVNLQVLQPA